MALTAQMVTIDCAEPRRLAPFWTAATAYRVAADYDGAYLVLAPSAGDGVRIGLQRVPEPRQGKNRVHIDFVADGSPTLADAVATLIALGATELATHGMPGMTWKVMADPEGNEFCVSVGE